MNPQRDDDSEPLQVWKRSLPEDEHDKEETGTAATLVVVVGVAATITAAILIGAFMLFDKYRHLVGL